MQNNDIRDGVIHQAQQERMVRDTLILQKVNSAHREAFESKFPGQIQHVLRLIAERLQAVLTNKPSVLNDPTDWATTPADIRDLSEALQNIYLIYKDIQQEPTK